MTLIKHFDDAKDANLIKSALNRRLERKAFHVKRESETCAHAGAHLYYDGDCSGSGYAWWHGYVAATCDALLRPSREV